MAKQHSSDHLPGWRGRIYHIIYEAESPPGRVFDVLLMACIFFSLIIVCIESIENYAINYKSTLRALEWGITGVFTVEYLLRILCVKYPRRYIFSFFGFIDFLSILPTYLSLFFAGSQSLIVIRAIRLLRVFRVLKLQHYISESNVIIEALATSRKKIFVFISAVLVLDIIFGAIMYLVEGPASGFASIPKSMYWAIVTMTTVGYGDITPSTTLGQMIASLIMITGYGILAVPTGIVTSEITLAQRRNECARVCPRCTKEGHQTDAHFCRACGADLLDPNEV